MWPVDDRMIADQDHDALIGQRSHDESPHRSSLWHHFMDVVLADGSPSELLARTGTTTVEEAFLLLVTQRGTP